MAADTINKLADSIFKSVQAYIAEHFIKREAALRKLVDDLVTDFPVPKDGANGKDGAPGAPGSDGAPGVGGKDGAPGADGKDGAAGDQGPVGEKGERGDVGERGEPGAAGKDGEPGKDGAAGERGPAGEPGPRGSVGKDGEPGKDGQDGQRGEVGEQGLPGTDGKPGERGEKGLDGDGGRDGRDGKDGAPGRDALQIDILPAIDSTRSYPRGTFACHAGGIVRSVRTTEPLADGDIVKSGWAVMVQGIAAEDEEVSDDGRTEKRVTRYTDGTVFERTIHRSIVIDRGVFKEGSDHLKGDGASWAGSFWIAQKDTNTKPDANDGSWRLAVKRGRDGATAFELARKHGFVGSEPEWLDSIKKGNRP